MRNLTVLWCLYEDHVRARRLDGLSIPISHTLYTQILHESTLV